MPRTTLWLLKCSLWLTCCTDQTAVRYEDELMELSDRGREDKWWEFLSEWPVCAEWWGRRGADRQSVYLYLLTTRWHPHLPTCSAELSQDSTCCILRSQIAGIIKIYLLLPQLHSRDKSRTQSWQEEKRHLFKSETCSQVRGGRLKAAELTRLRETWCGTFPISPSG